MCLHWLIFLFLSRCCSALRLTCTQQFLICFDVSLWNSCLWNVKSISLIQEFLVDSMHRYFLQIAEIHAPLCGDRLILIQDAVFLRAGKQLTCAKKNAAGISMISDFIYLFNSCSLDFIFNATCEINLQIGSFLNQFLDKWNMFMTDPDFCAEFMGADLPVTLYNKVPTIH